MRFKSILFLAAVLLLAVCVTFAFACGNYAIGLVVMAAGALALDNLNLGGMYQPGHLYANTLTNLIPSIVKGFDVVSRELVGFIPSVNRDPSADRIAKNQTLYSWVAPAATLANIAPLNVSPLAADKTLGTKSITVDNFKMSEFYFTGEEEKALSVSGSYGNIVTDMIEQAIRAIVNQMESDVYAAAYVGASRAYGTAATTPFQTNTGESAQIKKILDDNGAPSGNRSLILNTTTGAALRTLTQLTKVNEAGTSMTLRDGALLDLNNFVIKESSAITSPTVGTNSAGTSDGSAYAIGDTTITLTSDNGTILAGDVITFAGDTNKYVVATALASHVIVLAKPGLRVAQSTSKAVTVVASSGRNLGFSKNAILLATRLPARPSGGDMASDVQTITDPRSGISIEVSMYPQYRQVRYEVAAAWGVSVIKSEHIATLLSAA